MSLRCIGNRTYTGLGSDELYVAGCGADLEAVAETLDTIVSADAQLAECARGRPAQLSSR